MDPQFFFKRAQSEITSECNPDSIEASDMNFGFVESQIAKLKQGTPWKMANRHPICRFAFIETVADLADRKISADNLSDERIVAEYTSRVSTFVKRAAQFPATATEKYQAATHRVSFFAVAQAIDQKLISESQVASVLEEPREYNLIIVPLIKKGKITTEGADKILSADL